MRVRRGLLVLGAALLVAPPARADSWGPYADRRVPDAAGEFYVVVRAELAGPARFQYARRGPGLPPVTAAREDHPDAGCRQVGVREGDTVLASGELRCAPVHLLVDGSGFVAVEAHAQLGHGDSVVVVDAGGRVVHTLSLRDLFSEEEMRRFPRSVSSIWWLGGAWLDPGRGSAVLLAQGGLLRVVDREDGSVREGGNAELKRAVTSIDPRAREAAAAAAVDAGLPEVVALLETGGPLDLILARRLSVVDLPAAVPALVSALERTCSVPEVRDAMVQALRHQTGQVLGPDPVAWRRWLEGR